MSVKDAYQQALLAIINRTYNGRVPVEIPVSSEPLAKAGCAHAPYVTTALHIARELNATYKGYRGHSLSLETLEELPNLISDPVAIINNPKDSNSLMVVLDEVDYELNPVVAVIEPNAELKGSCTKVNFIKSVFGCEKAADYLRKAFSNANWHYLSPTLVASLSQKMAARRDAA